MLRAVLFDFDGLILDTEVPEVETYREIYADHGHEFPDEVWMRMIGISSPDMVDLPWKVLEAKVGPVDRQALQDRSRLRRLELIAKQPVQPGVVQALDACDRLNLRKAVVSSSRRSWVEGHLTSLGLLDRFESVTAGHEGEPSKPAPDLYNKALVKLHLSAKEAIAIEDSPNGIQAAVSAGLFTIAVPNRLTALLDLSCANLRLDSLTDVDWDLLVQEF